MKTEEQIRAEFEKACDWLVHDASIESIRTIPNIKMVKDSENAWAVWQACQSLNDTALAEKDADIAQLREALQALIALNEEYSPFGGEIYRDRIDATWKMAKQTLEQTS